MDTKQMIALADTVTKLATLADAVRGAASCDLRFPAGDAGGRGQIREVTFVFANPVAADALVAAVKALTVRTAAPTISGAIFRKPGE